MIPVLFDHSETAFTSNGICRLVDCVRCEVTEERNGIYECELDYPITGRHYDKIQIDRIIYATHDDSKAPQPFDVYGKSAPINGIVTFYAHHISYRLGNVLLNPFTATSCATALAQFNNYAMVSNPFTFQTDKNVTANFSVKVPVSIKAVLGGMEGSILDVYGTGEYEYDKFTVKLWVHRGANNGVKIRYSDSLSDLTHELDYSSSYNTVAPYWSNMDKTEVVMLPERYVFSNNAPTVSNNWTDDGTPITDDGGNIIEFMTSDGKAVPLDLSESFEEAPSVDDLRSLAVNKLLESQAWIPSENLRVDFIALWQTEDYANVAPLQTVKLCDTVTVLYPELGVNATVKVIKTVYDVLLDRYKEIELGDPKSSFADVVVAQASADVKESPTFMASIAGEVERATSRITGMTGGNVVINYNLAGKPYEILVMDTEDKTTAVNVMRINNAGIGFSTNGYSGPFTSAWTLDGHFVADFITAGTLSANLLRTGIVQSQDGGNYWNLDSGEFYTDTNDYGVNLKNGRVYFINPRDPDFQGFLSTYFINSSTPSVGIFSTTGYTVIGAMDVRGYLYEIAKFHPQHDDYAFGGMMEVGIVKSDALYAGDYFLNSTGVLIGKCVNVVNNNVPGSGVVYCVTCTQTSDRNLKNVQAWDDRYLDAFDDFIPTLFSWKDGRPGTYVGLIAQDVQKSLGDRGLDTEGFVTGGDTLGLNYSSIFSLMIAKVQEQQKKISELETRLESIERILNDSQ